MFLKGFPSDANSKEPPSKRRTRLKRLSMSTMFLKIIQRNGNQDFISAKVFERNLSVFIQKFFQVEPLTTTYFPTGCTVRALRQTVSINLWAGQEGNTFSLQKKNEKIPEKEEDKINHPFICHTTISTVDAFISNAFYFFHA